MPCGSMRTRHTTTGVTLASHPGGIARCGPASARILHTSRRACSATPSTAPRWQYLKGSGLSRIIDPCLQAYMQTEDYYRVCDKHNLTSSCFPNSFFPGGSNTPPEAWELP